MDKFILRTKHPDGTVDLSIERADHIIEMFGFRDCTGDELEVFASIGFGDDGDIVKLDYVPATTVPFNYHRFVDPWTREIIIHGYSTEH